VSLAFGQAARDAGIARSMGSKGDCYDNAVAESFFATLKKELVHRRSWPTRRELTSEAFEYIEGFYNRTRRHSTLGYLSPADYENNRTLIDDETSLAASRLASPDQEIKQKCPQAQPCPAKRGNSTAVAGRACASPAANDDRGQLPTN
jgi:Integrase core domain